MRCFCRVAVSADEYKHPVSGVQNVKDCSKSLRNILPYDVIVFWVEKSALVKNNATIFREIVECCFKHGHLQIITKLKTKVDRIGQRQRRMKRGGRVRDFLPVMAYFINLCRLVRLFCGSGCLNKRI
jgi:hypothetical protein